MPASSKAGIYALGLEPMVILRMKLGSLFLTLIFCVKLSAIAFGAESNRCEDPFIIRNEGFFVSWFPQISNPNLIVEIDQKDVNSGVVRVGETFRSKSIVVESDSLSSLRTFFDRRSNQSDIPLFISKETALASYILTSGEAAVIDHVFTHMFSMAGTRKAKVDLLKSFLATGGELTDPSRLDKIDGKLIVTENIVYKVQLGNEWRVFLLAACKYPAIIKMRRVKTITPPINPKIFEESDGDGWVSRDATTNLVDNTFSKTSEDDDFYYLIGAGVNYRLSRKGRSFDIKIGDGWGPIYQTTEVY